jgi:hypothetical protein
MERSLSPSAALKKFPTEGTGMKLKLEPRWTRQLANLPESGMGYQRVDVRLSDGREVINAVVFNGEDLELPDDCRDVEIADIRLHRNP